MASRQPELGLSLVIVLAMEHTLSLRISRLRVAKLTHSRWM
jgi:hypothetical protein